MLAEHIIYHKGNIKVFIMKKKIIIIFLSRYQYKWLNNTPATIFNDAKRFRRRLCDTKQLDCTDLDDAGMACYLAHTLEDKNVTFRFFKETSICFYNDFSLFFLA
jgi:hypothetical protein